VVELLFEDEAMANAAPEASKVATPMRLKLELDDFVDPCDFESKGASSFPFAELFETVPYVFILC